MVSKLLLLGVEAQERLETIARLRLSIFREFPYLYDGKMEDELAYLKQYADNNEAAVIITLAGEEIAGAATGLPLSCESAEMTAPFAATPYPVESIYYIGEMLFYPPYRNRGLGTECLSLMDQYVRSSGKYRYLTCATIIRPADHPLRPDDYLPIERFLERNMFLKLQGVATSFAWKELDGVRRDHDMQFWIKELTA